eukprot:scaffold31032_cov155-Skeletonema_dohrnii-CCMP3373.AAC.2
MPVVLGRTPWRIITYPADGIIFVYTGGRAPHHVINVIIDQSITVIDPRAFEGCLVESVACHDELESVIDVEFGDKLVTIELQAFKSCSRLKRVRMPSVRNIGMDAFRDCSDLEYVELSEDLQRISANAFDSYMSLKRIIIPLKQNMIMDDVFFRCRQLTAVDLAGGDQIMIYPILLPIEKARLLQEATTLLELTLWKAKLDEDDKKNMPDDFSKGKANNATTNVDDVRKDIRITSGASIAEHFVEEGYTLAADATTSAIEATGPFLNGLTNA